MLDCLVSNTPWHATPRPNFGPIEQRGAGGQQAADQRARHRLLGQRGIGRDVVSPATTYSI